MKHIKAFVLILLLALGFGGTAKAQTYLPGQLDLCALNLTNHLGFVGTVLVPISGGTNYTLIATNPAVTINGTNAIRFEVEGANVRYKVDEEL